ncbi:MAG: hypothetical protein N2512_04105 [Armatimonadetes bacterium]|nr:hypothetical protein [Armatimonadota bacterium]
MATCGSHNAAIHISYCESLRTVAPASDDLVQWACALKGEVVCRAGVTVMCCP